MMLYVMERSGVGVTPPANAAGADAGMGLEDQVGDLSLQAEVASPRPKSRLRSGLEGDKRPGTSGRSATHPLCGHVLGPCPCGHVRKATPALRAPFVHTLLPQCSPRPDTLPARRAAASDAVGVCSIAVRQTTIEDWRRDALPPPSLR